MTENEFAITDTQDFSPMFNYVSIFENEEDVRQKTNEAWPDSFHEGNISSHETKRLWYGQENRFNKHENYQRLCYERAPTFYRTVNKE